MLAGDRKTKGTGVPAHNANQSEPNSEVSFQFILKQFFLPAFSLVGTLFPLYLLFQYKSGELLDVLLMLIVWAALLVVYWLPVGMFLFRAERLGGWAFLAGYFVSLPFYFLTVFVGLGLLTHTMLPSSLAFHPHTLRQWISYAYATPTFYLIVLFFYLLVRRGRRLARVTQVVTIVVFASAITATAVLALKTDQYRWPSGAPSRFEITNAKIVDASGNRIIELHNVEVENGKIVQIVPAGAGENSWTKIDAQGGYLVPGLIDVHVHLQAPFRSMHAMESGFDFPYFMDSILGDYAPQRRAYLEEGVTAIRDMGGPAVPIFALRAGVVRHKLLGPRIFAVGRLVTSPRGHPVSTIWTAEIARQGAILASDPASLIAGLEKNYREGPPDAVKIIDGTIGMAPKKINREILDRAVAWAQSKNLMSLVHIETVEEAAEAVDAGATGIEHVATVENLPDSLVTDMVEHHTFADPTFGEFKTALVLHHAGTAEIERQLEIKYGFIRRLDAAGVRLTLGTDAPLVEYGEGYEDELDQFAKAGFSPAQILTIATVNNAAYLGRAAELGTLAQGYHADLFLVRANPLQDIRAVRKPVWVMLDGQIVVWSPIRHGN
jgi:imidazolonepropionase-like amidohydrolase